jgi:KTSC domain
MVYLNSSAIHSASYDESTLQLTITFASGGTYTYYGVPKSKYVGLINAASAGTYFSDQIRDQYSVN